MSFFINKNIYVTHKVSFFLTENNCNIIYEGEQMLIHLVRPITKEEKITQYDVNTGETVLV